MCDRRRCPESEISDRASMRVVYPYECLINCPFGKILPEEAPPEVLWPGMRILFRIQSIVLSASAHAKLQMSPKDSPRKKVHCDFSCQLRPAVALLAWRKLLCWTRPFFSARHHDSPLQVTPGRSRSRIFVPFSVPSSQSFTGLF